MAKLLPPVAAAHKRIATKLANIHNNMGMQSRYPSGIASTNRVKAKRASTANAGKVSAKMAGTKPSSQKGIGQPKVSAKQASIKQSPKLAGSKAVTSFGKTIKT